MGVTAQDQQSRAELLSCPFCGKQDSLRLGSASEMWDEESEGPFPHTETYAVFCSASSDDALLGCGGSGGYFLTKAEAIAAWNRRAPAEEAARALPANSSVSNAGSGALLDGVEPAFTRRHEDICGDEVGPPEFGYSASQVLAMGRVPPGWRSVPMESTRTMKAVGRQALKGAADCTSTGQAVMVFEAMCAAAPRPPAARGGLRISRVELTREQRKGLQADCKGPLPPAATAIAGPRDATTGAGGATAGAAQERKTVACACGDEFPIDSYGGGFLEAKGKCFGCDAADEAAHSIKEGGSNAG